MAHNLVLLCSYKFGYVSKRRFQVSVESNSDLHRLCIAVLSDWLKNIAPLCHPIRGKTQTNRDALGDVFQCFVPSACMCVEF